MRQLTFEELRSRIYVTIRTAEKHVLAKLRSKLPHEADDACRKIADRVADKLHGPTIRVVQADNVMSNNYGESPGKFGIDEPEP